MAPCSLWKRLSLRLALSGPLLLAVLAMLPADLREPAAFARTAIRKEPGRPAVQVLADRQKDWWETSLRAAVESALRRLAE